MSVKYKCFLVPTTHWDREWYYSVTRFRFRLVRLIDRILDILEKSPDYRCFWFDGQSVPVEDYLATCPENADRLTAALDSGRLLIGPWYSLADEFLINGESQIRNLRYGIRMMRRYGQENLIGYLPDTFGHTGQMPQILRNFGIDNAVLWRGYSPDDIKEQENFWQSPDDSQVRLCCLVAGYTNAAHLEPDHDSLAMSLPKLEKFAVNNRILLMNGIDHSLPETDLPSRIAWAQENYPQLEIHQATIAEYLDEVKPTVNAVTFKGELLYRPPLESVLSSRQDQKNLLRQAENLLIYYAEPLRALTHRQTHRGFLETAWKNLLKNAAHDSVCGCHDDQTACDVANRFRHAVELASGTLREDIAAPLFPDEFNAADLTRVRFFNPLAQKTVTQVIFEYRIPESQEIPEFPELDDGTPLQILSVTGELRQQFHDSLNPTDDPVKVLQLISAPLTLPGMGCCDFHIRSGKPVEAAVSAAGNILENAFVRAELHENGSFDLYDKETGRMYSGLNSFRFETDNGDLYTSLAEKDVLAAELTGSWHASGSGVCRAEINGKLRFPGKAVTLNTRFILDSHAKMVEIVCSIDQQEKNCRISADFAIPPASELFAQMPFDLVRCQPAEKARPMHFCTAAVDAGFALTVANDGLYELQYTRRDCFGITLLRPAGVIMPPLRGYPAASGRLPGVTAVRYRAGVTGNSASAVTAAGFRYNLPPKVFQVPENAPEIGILLHFSNENWFPCGVEDMGGDQVAVRFFNVSAETTCGQLHCALPFKSVVRILAGGEVIDTEVDPENLTVRPHEIVTLLFTLCQE